MSAQVCVSDPNSSINLNQALGHQVTVLLIGHYTCYSALGLGVDNLRLRGSDN